MTTRTKQIPCTGCIYEDCYPGICTACEEARKAELRKLSDLVKVYFKDWTLYRLKD